VKKGYKQTEIGLLPEDWTVRTLNTLSGDIGDGIHTTPKYSKSSDFFFINGNNLVDGTIKVFPETNCVSEEEYFKLKKKLTDNTILMSINGTICNLAFFRNERVVLGKSACYINVHKDVNKYYIFNQLKTTPIAEYYKYELTGTTINNLSLKSVRDTPIPLPPTLAEQTAIATALSDTDALIQSLEKLIVKKRAIKQGAMQELLTGKKRLPGFSGKWEEKQLGEIANVKTGPFGSTLHESDYVREGTPIITVEHLGEFGVLHSNLPLVSDTDRQRLRAYSLEIDDIVFSRVGSVDRNALIRPAEVGWLFSGRLLRVRPDKRQALAPFLSYQFHGETFKCRVRNLAVGQTMASLNTQILKNLSIVLPALPEQTAIAQILSDMDSELSTLEAKLSKCRSIKQGMMQELLTGKIRLNHGGRGLHR
jgi:type I restriction enzyme, S subunit